MSAALLQRLGFAADDRVLIVHADDIGMCQASVSAWQALLQQGSMSSASCMAACPWFPAVADIARQQGDQLDLGLHLTLTCEWQAMRWSPLTGNHASSGLVDAAGYMHHTAAALHQYAQVDVVQTELAAQLARAQAAGIHLSHLDSHMISLFHPRLMPLLLALARDHQLPAFLPRGRTAEQVTAMCGLPSAEADAMAQQLAQAEDEGHFLPLDSWTTLPFGNHLESDARLAWTADWLASRGPGIHALVGHPAHDTVELRHMAPDWATRVADLALFAGEGLRGLIAEGGFRVIGMRAFQNH